MKHQDFLNDYLKLKKGAIAELRHLLDKFPDECVDLSDEDIYLQLCPGGAEGYDSWQITKVTPDSIFIKNEYGLYEAEYEDFSVVDLDFIMDNMPEPDGD